MRNAHAFSGTVFDDIRRDFWQFKRLFDCPKILNGKHRSACPKSPQSTALRVSNPVCANIDRKIVMAGKYPSPPGGGKPHTYEPADVPVDYMVLVDNFATDDKSAALQMFDRHIQDGFGHQITDLRIGNRYPQPSPDQFFRQAKKIRCRPAQSPAASAHMLHRSTRRAMTPSGMRTTCHPETCTMFSWCAPASGLNARAEGAPFQMSKQSPFRPAS